MSGLPSSLTAVDCGVIPPNGPRPEAAATAWAVVSFLLEDTVWCDWIYREFDGERVPRPLLRGLGRCGNPYPERLSVCPDPSDSSELETYAESLQAAQHLILVISPASGRSSTLEDHRRAFLGVAGAERVIALIVKGEPASPAAEPGRDDDRQWLPDWLQARFEDNRFRPSSPGEPLAIDARLGMASLAEARAAMMAALLEVDRSALTELGVVTRPTTSLVEFPTPSSISIPPPTPSNIAFLEIATELPTPQRRPSLTIWIIGFAALVALGVLGFWPAPKFQSVRKLELSSENASHVTPSLAPDFPLVEARPLLDAPLPLPLVRGETAVALAAAAVSAGAPAPAIVAPARQNTEIADGPAAGSSRGEQLALRDRFTRLAESRMAEGNGAEALEILGHALDAGAEVLLNPNATSADSVDQSLLLRRAGTLAEGLSMPAAARKHYENGRRVLLDLRSREALSKDAMQMLGDLDSRLRQLRPSSASY
jgi:hypothetical protein